MKRALSFLLSFCICLTVVLSAMIFSGVQFVYASAADELWLKVDYPYALCRDTEIACGEDKSVAPYHYETGTAYLPLSALCTYQGAEYSLSGNTVTVKKGGTVIATMTAGSASWTNASGAACEFLLPVVLRDGMVYITILSAKDVFGIANTFYNKDVGIVILSEGTINITGSDTTKLKTLINTFAKVLFDRPDANTIYSSIENSVGVNTHPSIMADADKFAELRAIYNGEYTSDNSTFEGRVRKYTVSCTNAFYRTFTQDEETGEVKWLSEEIRQSVWKQPYYLYSKTEFDENGNPKRLVGQKSYTYYDAELGENVTVECGGSGRGDGYDEGGRSNVGAYTSRLRELAFAWQITEDDKYADAFYLLAKELGGWEHWGEGHFLNCADGAVEFAIGFDWIYHAFDDEPEKRDELARILYEKGMHMGYASLISNNLTQAQNNGMHISWNASGGWSTANRENNWQTVCGSGMIISALALAEYSQYKTEAMTVIERYLSSLEKCLLQYAPDGAYIESPAYWAYGTNTLVLTLAALESKCGTTFGYEDIIGLHDSFYFAVGIANSDYSMWNYHDSGKGGRIDYKAFYFASHIYADPTLARLRDIMLYEDGSFGTNYLDLLYYEKDLSAGAKEELALDLNFKGIDTAVFRSSWESGAVYTGLHAGPSVVTHGDMDTGNFILSMGGCDWVAEPGTENYNYPGFWNENRYKLYGKSVEGHSTIVIRGDSSIPYGQARTENTGNYPTIKKFYSDSEGGYAVTDMKVQYGKYCTSGKRGVMLTNSRSTVVLQDNITFSQPTSLTSVLSLQYAQLELSEDGRTAYLYNLSGGKRVCMRITLLSDNKDLKFRSVVGGETIFPTTIHKAQNAASGKENMLLSPRNRLFVEADNVTEYNVAFVFEMMRDKQEVVGYEMRDMSDWETVTDEWVKEANSGIEYPEDRPVYAYNEGHFIDALEELRRAKTDAARGEIIRRCFIYTTDYNPDNAATVEKAKAFMEYINEYRAKIELANELYKNLFVGM